MDQTNHPMPYRHLYNPRKAGAEELRRTFVARRPILNRLLDHLRIHARSRTPQHLLLTGPRGAGKTHLMTLLVRELLDSNLAESWRPIQLVEEEWGVTTLRELLMAAFAALAVEPADDPTQLAEHLHPTEALRTLRLTQDPHQGAELGLALLRELARTTGRRNLLIVENLDMIFDEQFDDALGLRILRSELMTGGDLMLIASSPAPLNSLRDHDNPLFGLLHGISLEDLSLHELEELLRRRAELEDEVDPGGPASTFLKQLDEAPHRLRALLFLTGGNPRTALMLYRVAVHGELVSMHRALGALLEELTNYFRERLRDLPPQERKVVLALAASGCARRPSEIAAEIGVSPSQASALIGRLVARGHLRLAQQQEGRGRYYVLREVLLRYWHQWRSNQRRFSRFVDFLAAWFRREELETMMASEEDASTGDGDGLACQVREAIGAQPGILDMPREQTLQSKIDHYSKAYRAPDARSLAVLASFRGRLEEHPEQARDLHRVCRLISTGASPESEEHSTGPLVASAFAEPDLAELGAILIGDALNTLLATGRNEEALAWIAQLDQWLPAERMGLFYPMEVAARHLRHAPEDARILDRQAPEVRAVVESIIEAVSQARDCELDSNQS